MTKLTRWMTWPRLRVAVLVLVTVYLTWLLVALGQRSQDAEQATGRAVQAEATAEDLAEDVTRVCNAGGQAAAKLGTACTEASRVQHTPKPGPRGRQGPRGEQGQPGRGITSTAIEAGQLVVAYTDGTRETIGPVIGPAGPPGPPGPPGRGIAGTSITEDGQLQVTYTDDTTELLGQVVGTDGQDGTDGRGIADVSAQDGRLLVTYTDGSTVDAGPLPAGPAGPQGPPGPRGPPGPPGPTCPDGYEQRAVLYTLAEGGTAEGIGCVRPESSSSPPEPSGESTPPIPTEGP